MNVKDVLNYGHLSVLKQVDGLSDQDWMTPGVCGFWSVKGIIAHLSSYEMVLVDLLRQLINPEADAPTLELFKLIDGDEFNRIQVAERDILTPKEILDDLINNFYRASSLIDRFSLDQLRLAGSIPWYGKEYDLEDFIVYTNYGHKREHCAQIAVFRDQLDKLT